MYEGYYGFTEKPFNLTPDPKYLYQSRRHTEAVAHLEYGRRERGGFIVITGEVGTGKTTLARYFLGRLPEGTATAVVLYPALTAAELLQKRPRPTRQEIREYIAGNYCRCTGYHAIVDAIAATADKRSGKAGS